MAENTIATAYVQIMPSMEGATTNISNAILPQIDGAAQSAGTSFGQLFGGKVTGALSKIAAPAAIATMALGAGKALFDLGERFDSMTDAIIIGTGASGEALDSLVDSAKNIATSVPTSFEEAGDVVQNLNTRLGITGDNLDELGKRVIEAGNLLGEKMNLDTLTGALNTFGVSNEDAADALDYLFNVGQATGISLNNLTGTLEKQAPALKALGFSFEESANMTGLLDKYGLDASGTMGRLTKVLADAADRGVPARQAYEEIVGQLQNYLEVGDEVAAMQLADEIFGTKGSAQFLDAVKQGALSLDELTNAALGAGDGIMGTMSRTEDFGEKLERLQNKAAVALAPLAGGIFDFISEGLGKVESFVDENSDAFNTLGEVLGIVANLAGTILSAALGILGKAFSGVMTIMSPVISLVQGIISVINSMISTAVEAVGPIMDAFNGVRDAIMNPIESARNFIKGAMDTISGIITGANLRLPAIKLPHFNINGGQIPWGIGGIGTPPRISIDWYAKGGIVDQPSLVGVGEAGKEAIVPLTAPNLAPFAEAVADRLDRGGDTFIFNITADSETTLQKLVKQAHLAKMQYA